MHTASVIRSAVVAGFLGLTAFASVPASASTIIKQQVTRVGPFGGRVTATRVIKRDDFGGRVVATRVSRTDIFGNRVSTTRVVRTSGFGGVLF